MSQNLFQVFFFIENLKKTQLLKSDGENIEPIRVLARVLSSHEKSTLAHTESLTSQERVRRSRRRYFSFRSRALHDCAERARAIGPEEIINQALAAYY